MELNFLCDASTWQSTQIIHSFKIGTSVMLYLIVKHMLMMIQQNVIITYAELQKNPCCLSNSNTNNNSNSDGNSNSISNCNRTNESFCIEKYDTLRPQIYTIRNSVVADISLFLFCYYPTSTYHMKNT